MQPRSDADWRADFGRRLTNLRVPISGTLELTHRCNLRCVHCYLGTGPDRRGRAEEEMTTAEHLSVLDQVAAAGCLNLVLSGGEPLVRTDFHEIYRHARRLGMVVTVFSNATLVTDEVVELLREHPPYAVDVSVYGATAETYERVTGVAGSYERCLNGIRRLVDAGVRVQLKTVVMSVNRHEVESIRRLADDIGISFRLDADLFPCLQSGDRGPIELRVSPEEAVALELSDPDRLRQWVEYVEEREGAAVPDRLYVCGAGETGFHVDPYGWASPCVMTTNYRYNLLESDFGAVWAEELGRLAEVKPCIDYECNRCELRLACTGCPAFNYHESGSESGRSHYLCAMADLRWKAIQAARADAEQKRDGGMAAEEPAREAEAE